jgi:hypothetical protein
LTLPTITGLKFFFEVTLGRPELMAKIRPVRVSQTLPVILSREEVGRLIESARNLKHRTALSVARRASIPTNIKWRTDRRAGTRPSRFSRSAQLLVFKLSVLLFSGCRVPVAIVVALGRGCYLVRSESLRRWFE